MRAARNNARDNKKRNPDMPWNEFLYPWLVHSALASTAILILGSGAASLCREPVRRLRIIELTLIGCLIVPWLGMVPGYPQLAMGRWGNGMLTQQDISLPAFPQRAVVQPFPLSNAPLLTSDNSQSAPTVETTATAAPTFDGRTSITALYLLGVALGIVWWLVGMVGLVRILWTAQPAPPQCDRLLADIAGRRSDRVRLLVSSRANQPFACVWWRATIILPKDLCDDTQAVRWALAHEWSHLNHHDFRAWLVASLVRMLFFYQPLVWWLRGQLRLCQDYVADAQASCEALQPEDYAEFLALRAAVGSLRPAMGGLGMGCRKSELHRRIVMLVQNRPIQRRTSWLWSVSVACAALFLVATVAALLNGPQAADISTDQPTTVNENAMAQCVALPDLGMATTAQLSKCDSDGSEKAITSALKWLAAHQMPDGGWNFNHTTCPACRSQCRNAGSLTEARNAATAMALLPFLGCGQTHKDGKYKSTIENGLSFLVSHMHVDPKTGPGGLNEPGGKMYSHGLATLALCEAYAMTHDKELLAPAQSALNFISNAQDPVGGGWRYEPNEKGDTSVFGWQLMALTSGRMAGLDVVPLTIQRASTYLDGVQSDDGAAYGYTDSKGSEATTAVGLLCRMYLGWKKDNPALQRGVKVLNDRGPSGANMYYNYYATQVMRHWEGEEWTNWHRQIRDQLIHAQAKQSHEEGSWFTGTGDNGAGVGGRLYCTAMAAMILEVYYRHLPLYCQKATEPRS